MKIPWSKWPQQSPNHRFQIKVFVNLHKVKGKEFVFKKFWPAIKQKLISKASLDKLEKNGNISRLHKCIRIQHGNYYQCVL